MDPWRELNGSDWITSLGGEPIRVVESQEQIATNQLVDNLVEQALLEQLLELNKPPLQDPLTALHYLLSTPFRYPPLRHGSRFGRRHERGVFYGSLTLNTALAETAYYRFVFWSGMTVPPPSGSFTTEHTAFGAGYRTDAGIRLQAAPFDRISTELTRIDDYQLTQTLGSAMRDYGVLAFEYTSARDPEFGLNVALFDPAALTHPHPSWQSSWLCETNADQVTYLNVGRGALTYKFEGFLVAGALPTPAI